MKAAKGCYSPLHHLQSWEQEIQYSLLALPTNRIPYWPQHFNTKQTGRHWQLSFIQYRGLKRGMIQFLGLTNVMVAGIRYTQNDLHTEGSRSGYPGTDFDLNVTNNYFWKRHSFQNQNIAFFVENLFKISQRFSISPGFRVENGKRIWPAEISYFDPMKRFRSKSNTITYCLVSALV